MRAVCIIPSRYGSRRLEGKALIDICGKPLIQRVYERASLAQGFDEVIVTTDDARIFEAVKGFGGRAVMTPSSLPTGTDRVARVVEELRMDHEVILNLQGDEPLIDPDELDRLVRCFEETPGVEMASLISPLDEKEDVYDVNQVKVVVDSNDFALYFSRHPIPYWRGASENVDWSQCPSEYWLHIGVYAFSRTTLERYRSWPRGMLEISESLEQLRALEHGVRIKMIRTKHNSPGVDTEEDVERVRKILGNLQE